MRTGGVRAALLASWGAAERRSRQTGEIVLNHASAAGWLLAQFPSASLALEHVPEGRWWWTVAQYLRSVLREEAPLASTRAGTTGELHAIRR